MKLQTTNLTPNNSAPSSGNRSAPSAGSAQSWEPSDEQEIITGASQEDDDDLAAPSPVVRHGAKEDEIAIRNKRFSKFSVYPNPVSATIRTVGPDRNLSPQGRTPQPIPSIATTATSSRRSSKRSSTVSSPNFSRNPSPHAISPPGTVTLATYKHVSATGSSTSSGASTPATYHTAVPSRISPQTSYPPSANLSRHSFSQPAPPNSHNPSRQSLILPHYQQQQQQHPHRGSASTYHTARMSQMSQASLLSHATRQAPLTNGAGKDVSRRGSQQAMSGMSPTVQALYGQHERDWRKRQSVEPGDLVARGLDEGVFAGLR